MNRRGLDVPQLAAAARDEIAAIYPRRPLSPTDCRDRRALRPTPATAGFARDLTPAPAPTYLDNVFLAGDQTGACSIQSAMVSGERSAAALARWIL